MLNYNWEEVHQEAEILEHKISDLFLERIDKLLNYPETCPHGGVIPRNYIYKEKYNDSLLEYDEGDNIEIVSKDKTNKVMIINNDTTMTILSYDNAMNIFVEKN